MINKTEKEIMANWNVEDNGITLSIFCITYNLEEYIGEALDSMLMQETKFPFNIVIGDDCSIDSTVKVINKYIQRYPNIIKLIARKNNIGYTKNFSDTFLKCKGKYVAFCEGDDYWTDTYKLQKQVDFLEQNLDFMGCVHDTKYSRNSVVTDELVVNNTKDVFYFVDYASHAYAHTSSFVFRNESEYTNEIREYFKKWAGDLYSLLVFSKFGPIKRIAEVMSVYRTHAGGIHSLTGEEKQMTSYLTNILILGDIFHEERGLFIEMFVNVLTQKLTIMPDDFFDNLFVQVALHTSKEYYRDIIKKLILEKSKQEKIIIECNNYIALLESQTNKGIIKRFLKKIKNNYFDRISFKK